MGYRWAWRLQHLRREAVIAGTAPSAFWLLEHPPVITTGRRTVEDLPDAAWLRGQGVELFHAERGGLATFHNPGQLVGYLIVDIQEHQHGIKSMVHAVEQGLIDWLIARGVDATRRCKHPGVWVGRNKVAAVGMHFRKNVSMHGFALNLKNDLTGFGFITPCGITDGGVTSFERLTDTSIEPFEASQSVGEAIRSALLREQR